MKLTKEQKAIAKITEAMFYKLANGIQFNIMDLGKVLGAAEKAGVSGQDMEAAIKEAISKYRQN